MKALCKTLALLALVCGVSGSLNAAPAGYDSAARESITPKPTAPIEITHRVVREAALGQAGELIVVVTARADIASGAVRLAADDGLELIAPPPATSLAGLANGESVEISLTVLPLADSRLMLRVSVGAEINGSFQGRALAILVYRPAEDVSASKTDAVEAADPTSGAERLQVMPAVEIVR